MIETEEFQRRLAITALAVAILLAWVCYRPALSGAYQLDDVSNLGGLEQIEDYDSGLDFVLSGQAGPLGRPIALLTFAVQAESWVQGAAAFLRVNVFIHLLNALLVALCVFRMTLCMRWQRRDAHAAASITAGLWVLLPLLASASMMVVQRMTTLSATFVLLGLAGYLIARSRIGAAPSRALLGMSTSLVVGTLLAMLTKESGLLLPVFVLVLEATVLEKPANIERRLWRGWQALFLAAPLLLILAYLGMRASYPDWVIQRRGFDAGERLLTEARMLWLYLFKAVAGRPDSLGIFQVPPVISRSVLEPLTLLASSGWLLLLGAALAWRRRWPIAAFAVLWFLAGHLIESTVIPLEIYFEHRNYLPVIGPLFAAAAGVMLLAGRARIAGITALLLFGLMNCYFLLVFASLWGEPSMASRHWAMRYPDSVRAVTNMASYQLQEEGALTTLRTIDNFVNRRPEHAYLRIQELNLLCRVAPSADHSQVIDQLQSGLPNAAFTYTAGTMLSQLFDAALATDCAGVSPATVVDLATVVLDNPRYSADPVYRQFHHKLLAGIARRQGDFDTTLSNLQAAISHRSSAELNMMMVTTLVDAGDFDAAYEFIDDAADDAPVNPLRAYHWHRDLAGLKNYVGEMERSRQ